MTGMLRAILSATLVLLVCPAPTRGDETDELLERARNEYPAAVKRLEMAYSRVRGSGRSETRIPILTTPVERAIVTDFSIAFDGDRKRVVQSIVDSTPQKTRTGDRVYCMNGEHAFWLSRDTSGKPYLLNGHGTAEDGYLAVADDEIMGAAGSYLSAASNLYGMPMSWVLESSLFRFTKARPRRRRKIAISSSWNSRIPNRTPAQEEFPGATRAPSSLIPRTSGALKERSFFSIPASSGRSMSRLNMVPRRVGFRSLGD